MERQLIKNYQLVNSLEATLYIIILKIHYKFSRLKYRKYIEFIPHINNHSKVDRTFLKPSDK